ncbi:MAG: O-antigen ligase family protein [Chitinophagaceae bacterium]|nr:O-antigen ligase family protein [Chitinophagaceae bacterium]
MQFLQHLDRGRIWFLIILLTAASFPWSERLNSVGIVLLLIHWLSDMQLLTKIRSIRWDKPFIICWSFFLLHVLALLWSDYPGIGYKTIEVKLVFLLLPLFFSTENHMDKERWKILLFVFTISCLLSFLYLCGYSFVHYRQLGFGMMFKRMYISYGLMHPGYYSNYIALAITGAMLYLIGSRNKDKPYRIFYTISILVLLLTLILMASKTTLIYIGILAIYTLWLFSSFIQQISYRIGAFVLMCLIAGTAIVLSPPIQVRIQEMFQDAQAVNKQTAIANSTASRIIAWDVSMDLIGKKWLSGYGTGAADTVLRMEMAKQGYQALSKDMSAHNQWLRTWLNVGLSGVFLLIAFFVFIALDCLRKRKHAGLWMLLLIAINLFTDDMLEIQAGIVFFLFFMTLILYSGKRRLKGYYS